MARDPVCIACGQPTGPLPRLNRLPDGRTCSSCRDRILEAIPAPLPSPHVELGFEEWAEEGEEPGEDYPRGA
jgi:hypothetical protein